MDNNAKLEKLYAQLTAGETEKDLDNMLDEATVGGATPAATPVITAITSVIVAATAGFDFCPTSGCTYSCRV